MPDADGITEGWKPKSAAQAAGRASGDSRRAKSSERAHSCECALLAHMYQHDTDSAEGIPAAPAPITKTSYISLYSLYIFLFHLRYQKRRTRFR